MQLNFYQIFNNMFISKGVSEKISKKTTCSSDTQKKSVSVLREQPQHYLRNINSF